MAQDYRAAARRAARKHGLDPNIFVRQIQQESGFNPKARSPKGAAGIAQIMPATARSWGVDPMDPIASLDAAAGNMASYVKKYGGYENALRAYNAGPGAIQASKGYAETNNYVRTILRGRDPGKIGKPSAQTSSSSQTTRTTPGQTTTSEVTSGGDFTLPQLAQRQKPAVTAPASPSYVKTPSVQFQMPDLAGRQASIKDAIARIGNVPQETTTATSTSPAQTTTTTSQSGRSSQPTGKGGSKVLELIFNDGGQGYGIKDGRAVKGSQVFNAVWGGHADHVHVAAGPKTVVAIGKAAQRMGLHVGENPHFGGVTPVHVPGSYHNKAEAIDVSGDKALMGKFARYVANYNRTREL
jgi:hypothetical protein